MRARNVIRCIPFPFCLVVSQKYLWCYNIFTHMSPPGTHLCTRSNNWVAERLCTSWGSQLLNTFLWYPDTMTYIRIGSCVRTCSSIRIYVWAYATVCVIRCVRTHFTNRGMCQNVDNVVVSLVGARFARPKTVCFVSSGRRTLPLGTKRQHCPHFDTSPCL